MDNVKDFIFSNGNKIKVIIDVDTLDDPDMFGQILRTYAFKATGKLENTFKDVTKATIGRKFDKKFMGQHQEDNVLVSSDGNLYIGESGYRMCIAFNGRSVITEDSRNDYGWQFVNLS